MTNIVAMRAGQHIPALETEPDAELIEILENLLAGARSGHLRAIAYTTVTATRSINTK
jgi:hypothetical protein